MDCSGFISRVWGFTSKLGTYDIASNNITEEITQADIDIKKGDVYVIGGNHPGVMAFTVPLFDEFMKRIIPNF